jgi:broad specificity phosphatase PhoE
MTAQFMLKEMLTPDGAGPAAPPEGNAPSGGSKVDEAGSEVVGATAGEAGAAAGPTSSPGSGGGGGGGGGGASGSRCGVGIDGSRPCRRYKDDEKLVVAVRETPLLVEQDWGTVEGNGRSHFKERHQFMHQKATTQRKYPGGMFYARMPSGESFFDVGQRVHQLFGAIQRDRFHAPEDEDGRRSSSSGASRTQKQKQPKGDTIIVVSHGLTIRAFVMMWCRLSPEWLDLSTMLFFSSRQEFSAARGVRIGCTPVVAKESLPRSAYRMQATIRVIRSHASRRLSTSLPFTSCMSAHHTEGKNPPNCSIRAITSTTPGWDAGYVFGGYHHQTGKEVPLSHPDLQRQDDHLSRALREATECGYGNVTPETFCDVVDKQRADLTAIAQAEMDEYKAARCSFVVLDGACCSRVLWDPTHVACLKPICAFFPSACLSGGSFSHNRCIVWRLNDVNVVPTVPLQIRVYQTADDEPCHPLP